MNEVNIQEGSNVPDALPVKFDLEVLASTCVKCKKPWPRLAFVGEVSFFLSVYLHCFLCYTAKFINDLFEELSLFIDNVVLRLMSCDSVMCISELN